MQTLRIIIPGKFWDSQIYSGRLYIFGMDGSLATINWDTLISSIRVPRKSSLALICSFLRSDFLYGPDLKVLFHDRDIKREVRSKFTSLGNHVLELTADFVRDHYVDQQTNPLPFPHTDSEIYKNNIYVSSSSGIKYVNCHKQNTSGVSPGTSLLWEAPVLSISVNYNSVAAATGSAGLYEVRLPREEDEEWFLTEEEEPTALGDPTPLYAKDCTECNWMYQSILGSSPSSNGILASFTKHKEDNYYERDFEELIPVEKVFGADGYCWGAQDKLYQVQRDQLVVAQYRPSVGKISKIGQIQLPFAEEDIVSAGVAQFGVIIEYDESILVLSSNGEQYRIAGEPTNWRVFPRSKYYENQLHVILDDRLEIYSFNHDYLVDQKDKLLGTKVLGKSIPKMMKSLITMLDSE